MVNTEKLGVQDSRLHFAIAKAVGPLIHELGEKLVADATLETMERIERLPSAQNHSPTEVLASIDNATASTLASDVAVAAGIHLVAADLNAVEQEIGVLLANRARGHMNTLEHIPHIATQAAQFLVSLEATSLQRGPGAKAFAETLGQIKNAWDEKEQALQKMEHVSLADFQTFRTDKLERAIGFALQSLVTACASLQAVAAEAIFPLRDPQTRSRNATPTMTTLIAFENQSAEHNKLLAVLDAAKSSSALRKARHNIAIGRWVNALDNVCESAQLTQKMVSALRAVEPSPSHDPRQSRFLSGENFLYVKALARQLLMTGAAPRDVEKLTDALYEYGHKNDAACAELIDEEILALNPNIRREALAKSRLEVRLSDKNFPLSARHKEWIVQTTKAFLQE